MPVGGGNPFWSEKATTEFRLAVSRPMDLPPERYPVPGDDEEVRRQLEQEEEQDFAAVENGSEERGRRRSRSRLGTPMAEMAFTTPESWMNQGAVTGGPLRTAGRMPEEGAEGSQARGGEPLRSQGAVFQADHGGDDLQREVEKEVVRTLQEENEQLRRKMQELMQKMEEKSGNSDWSEVSAGSPRLRKGAADRREEVRYTPNGTQVPTGPPPVTMEGDRPPVPPWPFPDWEVYEKDEGGHTRRMEIDSREWQLHRGLYGGGASSRHTDCGRGTGSRQEVRHQEVEGSLGDPQVDRERWLMRELVQLQQALDSEKRSKVRWRVDQEGHLREVPLSRADHHGRQGQVPLCRAGQPGKGEQAPLSRASYQGLNEGDRAWQPQHGDLRDNRAWQAQQADGGSQDQGGNHRTVELPEVLVRELDLQNARWKNKIAELKEVEVVNLTLAVPLRSRHAPEVLRAVSSLYVRLRGLGLPIYRLHSDRAREFTGKLMRDWILSHDMEHTTTAADESAGNGRVESEIAHLKHHTKLLLTTARAPPTYWPMALRHASEYRLRKTLEQLGVPVPRLIPFGTEAIAKSKFWHRTMKGFPTPMQKVKVWGPAVGMSLSSKGYWIEADGKWMRSTVVVQPGARPDLRPELPLEERAENLDNASIAMSEDQPDVVATNQADEAGHPVVNLENIDQDDQVQWVPKRRFHMKKPLIPGSEDATLRMRMLCSNRGECSQEEALDNAWATLEHLHLRKLETEERQLTTGDQQSMEVIAQLEEQCKNIEKNMEDQKASREGREGEAVVEEEVLVNQPVSLEEVRRNLPQWKEALKKEYDSLIGYGAIRPIGSKEYAELQEQYEVVESIPTMLVAVKKPPLKLKARVVACGNHAQEATGCTTAGGVDTVVVRTLVSLAAHKDLTILTSDIKTAFLQAPRRLTPGRVTILTPPAILREAQLLQLQGERWVVEKAMYGLTESPKDWGDFRNLRMSSMKWSSQGFQRWLRRSPEPHLWEVCQQDVVAEESQPSVICHVAVYVDDLMVTGKREDAREVMDQLAKTFQMTSPEEVSESQEVTFCGYQIQKTETGFALHQQKYVQEVLQKHGIQCSESVPCLKISDGPEEQDPAREDIKQAQIVTGELGWLTSRTRPDLAFSVSIMARMIHKRPKWVTETGMQVLKYLHGSKGWGLNYTRIDDPTVLNVLVDASYAPPHEGYRSVQGAIYMHGSNVLMWSSSRQGFITQSTAEAELLAYNESAQGAESVAHLLECFDMKVARRLIGDSKSGLVQLTGEVGSWRTRHLRLRSAKLRELIQHGVDGWHAVHRDGKELAADGMTKPLAGQAFVRFRSMLFMKDCDKKDAKENTICIPAVKTCSQVDSSTSLRDLGCGLLGAGSALLATGNKKLALALVASGVALCWKEGGKRPASKAIEQRPHKSPENEGGKGQTMLGKGGAAHLKEESRAGTTEEVSKSMRIQELETVGRSPGLRAYRVTGAGSRSSHGSSSSAGPSTSADPSTEERRGLSVPPGLSPFPEGALFDDASGLLEQGQQVPRQRRALTEDERRQLNREMRERIQSLEERVDRLTLEGESVRKNPEETVVKNEMKSERRYEGMQRALVPAEKPYKNKDGTVEQPPWKGSRTTSSAAASSGGVGPVIQQGIGWWPQIPQAVVGGPPCSQWSENVESEKPKAPWSRDRFPVSTNRCRALGHEFAGGGVDREGSLENQETAVPSSTQLGAGGCKRATRSSSDQEVPGGWTNDHHPGPLDR